MKTYRYKIGSNQHKKIRKSYAAEALLVFIFTFYAGMLFLKNVIFAATPDQLYLESLEFGEQTPVYISAETTIAGTSAVISHVPTKEDIVAYIMKVFGKYGTDVGVKAIECFYSESGLREEAYNFNRNGTEDRGVAQINSIHGMTAEDAHDYIKNIDMAEKIYLRAGRSFRPWYGKLCN